jgi:hypothetical protein
LVKNALEVRGRHLEARRRHLETCETAVVIQAVETRGIHYRRHFGAFEALVVNQDVADVFVKFFKSADAVDAFSAKECRCAFSQIMVFISFWVDLLEEHH